MSISIHTEYQPHPALWTMSVNLSFLHTSDLCHTLSLLNAYMPTFQQKATEDGKTILFLAKVLAKIQVVIRTLFQSTGLVCQLLRNLRKVN